MLFDFDEENVSILLFWLIKLIFLENFIFGDGWGIYVVNIDFVLIIDFYFKFFLKGVKKICEYENSVGGNLEILEVFFFEIFVRWKKVRLDKVSRVWFFVYFN